MKTMTKIMLLLSFTFILFSCDDDDYLMESDLRPPAPPTGVYAINGDDRIDIAWNNNGERDLSGYNIYFSYDNYEFELIGSSRENYYVDYDARNGEVYYYAVTAYDYDGNESDLSAKTVVGIARPEGFNQAVFDYIRFPETSGYSFSEYLVVPYNSEFTDFFFENYEGTFYINVWDDTDIQDMGQTYDIYEIAQAPIGGWIPLKPNENVKYTEVYEGHTYVIRTWDNHYAKIRVAEITTERMSFDWAFQLIEGERLLKPGNNATRDFKYTTPKARL